MLTIVGKVQVILEHYMCFSIKLAKYIGSTFGVATTAVLLVEKSVGYNWATSLVFGGRQCPLVVWWLHFMATVPCSLHHQLLGFKQQERILSRFWRPEDPSQGVVRALVPLKALVKNPSWSLPASSSWQHSLKFLSLWPGSLLSLSPSSYGLLSHVSLCVLSPSSKGSTLDLGHALTQSDLIETNYICKDSSSTVTFWSGGWTWVLCGHYPTCYSIFNLSVDSFQLV